MRVTLWSAATMLIAAAVFPMQAQAFCAYSSGRLLRTSRPCNAVGTGTAQNGCRSKMTAIAMNADHARMCQLPLPSVQMPSRSILRLVLLKMAWTLAAVIVCVACASSVASFRGGAASTPPPPAASIRTSPTASFGFYDPSTSDAARRVPVHVQGAWTVGFAISTYAVSKGTYILSIHVMRNQLRAAVAGTKSLPDAPNPVFKSMLEKRTRGPVPRDRRTLTAVLLAEQAQKRALQRSAPQGQTTASHTARRGLSPGASRLAVVGVLEKKRWNGTQALTPGKHGVDHVDKHTLGRFWDRNIKDVAKKAKQSENGNGAGT